MDLSLFLYISLLLSLIAVEGAREPGGYPSPDGTELKRDTELQIYTRATAGLINGFFKRKKPAPVVLFGKTQELNLQVAKILAEFVSISYCSNQTAVDKWTCTRCQHLPEFRPQRTIVDTAWHVTGFVGYYPPWKAKIVVFRGTDGPDLRNWMENLKVTQHQVRLNLSIPGFDELRVHNGFSRIWNIPFKNGVMSAVEELDQIYGRNTPLYIAGHSAGGATAQLAAFAFKTIGNYPDVRLYTYGAPRVGNWPFASMLSNLMTESWRFTHHRDPVPTVPWLSMGFWHAAQEVYQQEIEGISPGHTITTLKICDGTGEDPHGHNSRCRFGFGCSSIYDHFFYLNTIMENDGTC